MRTRNNGKRTTPQRLKTHGPKNQTTPTSPAIQGIPKSEILEALDPTAFAVNRPELPSGSTAAIIDAMHGTGALTYSHEHGWTIPTWSALMYARRLSSFPTLRGVAPRVFHFADTSRVRAEREWELDEGFALSFSKVIELFNAIRPGGESIDTTTGRRIDAPLLPTIAFREVYANALMHQELGATGQRVLVEVFADRVEVSNPGVPLVSPQRFIDAQSTTRNALLGGALRLAHFVEQRGSGWDKIVASLEAEHFPPALVRTNGSTTVTLSAFRPFALMSSEVRIQAVYQHACLAYLNEEPVNNRSIRQRFGLRDSQAAQATRLLNATVEEGLVVPYDADVGPRALRYVPFWAAAKSLPGGFLA